MVRYLWRGTLTQPFASKFFKGIWGAHPNRFTNKTVLVQNNDTDEAFSVLSRLMEQEGLMKIIRNTRYYQKPWMQRNTLAKEASSALVREDCHRKMRFLARKRRADAYPGQITA